MLESVLGACARPGTFIALKPATSPPLTHKQIQHRRPSAFGGFTAWEVSKTIQHLLNIKNISYCNKSNVSSDMTNCDHEVTEDRTSVSFHVVTNVCMTCRIQFRQFARMFSVWKRSLWDAAGCECDGAASVLPDPASVFGICLFH